MQSARVNRSRSHWSHAVAISIHVVWSVIDMPRLAISTTPLLVFNWSALNHFSLGMMHDLCFYGFQASVVSEIGRYLYGGVSLSVVSWSWLVLSQTRMSTFVSSLISSIHSRVSTIYWNGLLHLPYSSVPTLFESVSVILINLLTVAAMVSLELWSWCERKILNLPFLDSGLLRSRNHIWHGGKFFGSCVTVAESSQWLVN
jgi:hypothetical protein